MYVVCTNGILIYNDIDKKDKSSMGQLSNEFKNQTLQPGTMDCTHFGKIVFDMKSTANESHQLRCYLKTAPEEKYNFPLDGDKKIIKFFNNFVIEVKTEKGLDKVQIYDFDNKLSLFNASYPQIYQVEVEKDAIFMQVTEKSGKLAVYQLTEMENNLKI